MNSDFSDVQRAVAYFSAGLLSTHPDAEVDLCFFGGPAGPVRRTTVSTRDAHTALDRICRNFHAISVAFTPEHAYGLVGTLRSRPELAPGGLRSLHPEEDPYVTVILRRQAQREILVGTRNPMPHQPYRAIRGI